jgi:hypothetical protein
MVMSNWYPSSGTGVAVGGWGVVFTIGAAGEGLAVGGTGVTVAVGGADVCVSSGAFVGGLVGVWVGNDRMAVEVAVAVGVRVG